MTLRHYLLLVFAYSPPQSLWFIHNIWASSLTGKPESLSAEWSNGRRKECRRIVNSHSDIAKCHVLSQGTSRMQIKIISRFSLAKGWAEFAFCLLFSWFEPELGCRGPGRLYQILWVFWDKEIVLEFGKQRFYSISWGHHPTLLPRRVLE